MFPKEKTVYHKDLNENTTMLEGQFHRNFKLKKMFKETF